MAKDISTIQGINLINVLKQIGFEEVGGAYICYEDGTIELVEVIIGDGDMTISDVYDYPDSGWDYQNHIRNITWSLWHLVMVCELLEIEWLKKVLVEYCEKNDLDYPVKY